MKNILLLCLLLVTQDVFSQLPMNGKKVHIYLLVGQSNMAGRGTPEAIDTLTDPNIWMFSKEEKWVPAREPLHFDKPAVIGVGPGYAFAKEILKADKNVTICLIPAAVGGTRIDLWKPGAYDEATKTHPWDDAIRRAKAALPSGELKGIIWHQGESDANETRSPVYESKLRDLIERFRSELNAPNVPFILGEIGDFKPGENKEIPVINAIIKNVAATTKNSGLAEAKGLVHRGDFTHFDAASARELGKRYAAALLAIKK
ncbi:MAG: sialate O-acetylesterase [Bacteroidota bacterium]